MVSVIIPSYNRARTILPAVESVLKQTYSDLELWVVDDCSTDNTEQVLAQLQDPRLHYFRLKKNSGACTARNKGIELATGEYIAFNDSDDQWRTDKLEKQLAFLEKTRSVVVTCAMTVKDEEGNTLHDFPDHGEEGPLTYESLLLYNCCSTQLILGKAECFKQYPFDPSMPRLQDWDEMLRLAQHFTMCFQKEILVDAFVQKDSITNHPERGVIAMDKLFEKHRDAIVKKPCIAESFFRKKAAFVCQTGKNPTAEFKALRTYAPSFANTAKYLLARTGLYLPLFNHRH